MRRLWGFALVAVIAILTASYPVRPVRTPGRQVAPSAAVPVPAAVALVDSATPRQQQATPTPALTGAPSGATAPPVTALAQPSASTTAAYAGQGTLQTATRLALPTVPATDTAGPEHPERPLRATPPIRQVLGRSTLGWSMYAYRFGTGPVRVAFVGGIHGGYEANTILLAYRAIDHFTAHPDEIPRAVSLFIVPVANPDGLARLVKHGGRFTPDELPDDTLPGRFNGHDVDLNRNWDVGWSSTGFWGRVQVDAGSQPFSEVETRILRDFLTEPRMAAVVFWHSAKPGVYMASCDGIFPPSETLAALYANAAGYPLFEAFTDYPVSGTASDGLACRGVPAIAVELTDHSGIDWPQNLAAMRAMMDRSAAPRRP